MKIERERKGQISLDGMSRCVTADYCAVVIEKFHEYKDWRENVGRYDWLLLRLQIENRPTSMRGACGWSSSQFVPRWRLARRPRTQPSNA